MPENTDWQRICVITEYIGVDWIDVEVDLHRAVEEDSCGRRFAAWTTSRCTRCHRIGRRCLTLKLPLT